MGDERKELLEDVGRVIKDTLTLHHQENGYVTRGTCKANTELLKEGMKAIAGTIERVHGEMCHQRKATVELGKATGKLSTDLIAHTAEHAGIEKAKSSNTSRWKIRLGVIAAIVGVLGLLGTAFGWAYSVTSDMEEMQKRPRTIVIDKEAAKEIAKAVNDH